MTDASVCPDTQLAGFGYWCVSNRGNAAGGGILSMPTADSFIGEFKAAVNGLVIALQKGIANNGDIILIQLDNKGVVDLINGKTSAREDIKEVQTILKQLIKLHNLVVMSRHVKGHTSNKARRSIANKMCDLRAREYLNKARMGHQYE